MKAKAWTLEIQNSETREHFNPDGPERHLNAARENLLGDNFYSSTAAELPSPRGQFSKSPKKNPLLWGEAIWEACPVWERVIASQRLLRDNGESIFATMHLDVSQGPLWSTIYAGARH